MASIKNYFSTTEAAEHLQVSRDTLLRWFREGRVQPVQKDGRGWRYFTGDDIRRIAREAGLPSTLTYNQASARKIASKAKEPLLANWPISKPLRLIQYLGSKLRSLPDVVPVIEQNTPEDGSCLDLFAGTTVVGQGLLHHCSVYSNDCLLFSKVFGDVLISGPDSHRDVPLPDLSVLHASPAYRRNIERLTETYLSALEAEDYIERTILKPRHGKALVRVGHTDREFVLLSDGSIPGADFYVKEKNPKKGIRFYEIKSALNSVPASIRITRSEYMRAKKCHAVGLPYEIYIVVFLQSTAKPKVLHIPDFAAKAADLTLDHIVSFDIALDL